MPNCHSHVIWYIEIVYGIVNSPIIALFVNTTFTPPKFKLNPKKGNNPKPPTKLKDEPWPTKPVLPC
jgi:hypothetical protein